MVEEAENDRARVCCGCCGLWYCCLKTGFLSGRVGEAFGSVVVEVDKGWWDSAAFEVEVGFGMVRLFIKVVAISLYLEEDGPCIAVSKASDFVDIKLLSAVVGGVVVVGAFEITDQDEDIVEFGGDTLLP